MAFRAWVVTAPGFGSWLIPLCWILSKHNIQSPHLLPVLLVRFS